MAIALCLVAAVIDVRTYRIPNVLVLVGLAAGLGLNAAAGFSVFGGASGLGVGLLSSLAGAIFLFVIFVVLSSLRFVGLGDAKLLAAVGALLRWPSVLWVLAYVSIAGGVLGLIVAASKGRLGMVFRNLFSLSKRLVGGEDAVELHRIPYAVAIFLGVCWVVAAKHLPALRLG
ncbi:MAG: prepilin peptidase [Deltaproteobacteria bacterium]|nr:prepilin peptidase [Deltaproteobacteria bacterium]